MNKRMIALALGALICLGPRKNAGFSTAGVYNSVDYYGDTKPDCIVVWGANPTTSGADGELQWHPRICAQQGTHFIVIDPQKTKLAEKADQYYQHTQNTNANRCRRTAGEPIKQRCRKGKDTAIFQTLIDAHQQNKRNGQICGGAGKAHLTHNNILNHQQQDTCQGIGCPFQDRQPLQACHIQSL